jgi:hypothetical protein
MQVWMFLVAGRKSWVCHGPEYVDTAFDREKLRFYDSRRDRHEAFPDLEACNCYEGEIGAGDLFYFPAG